MVNTTRSAVVVFNRLAKSGVVYITDVNQFDVVLMVLNRAKVVIGNAATADQGEADLAGGNRDVVVHGYVFYKRNTVKPALVRSCRL